MCEARRTKKHTLPGVMITILYANIMKLLYYREIPPLQRAESTLCSSVGLELPGTGQHWRAPTWAFPTESGKTLASVSQALSSLMDLIFSCQF